jgi:hypothetical protein
MAFVSHSSVSVNRQLGRTMSMSNVDAKNTPMISSLHKVSDENFEEYKKLNN